MLRILSYDGIHDFFSIFSSVRPYYLTIFQSSDLLRFIFCLFQ